MNWFEQFRRKEKSKQSVFKNRDFGRFSDAYKPAEKYQFWEESLVLFDQGKRFSAFQLFFKYLGNENDQNVKTNQIHGVVDFELIQGSKKITGTIDAQTINCQATLAISSEYPTILLLELLQENYNLKFCKFALAPNKNGQNDLVVVANLPAKVTSPYKLYYVLRELALVADKRDDLIFNKYGLAGPYYQHLHQHISQRAQNAHVNFIQTTFRKALEIKANGPIDTNTYPSTYRYILLAAIYKVDFLVIPNGYLMDQLEKVDGLAFSSQTNDPKAVNQEIESIIKELLQLSQKKIKEELYRTDATFGFNPVIQSAQIRDTIFSELPTMDWYLENEYTDYAIAIVDFIVGYLLFNFIVPPPCKALFLLYYRIQEQAFFKELGYIDVPFREKTLSSPIIKKEIKKVLKAFEQDFPYITTPVHLLAFDSEAIFCKSYLEMVADINFTPK